MIVVDNSIVVGFVFPADAYHAHAMACRLKDSEWIAPPLIQSECRSVANGHVVKGEALDTVLEALDDARAAVRIEPVSNREVMTAVRGMKFSAYDAEYVALARRMGCRLVTTDRDVLKACSDVAVRLADFVA